MDVEKFIEKFAEQFEDADIKEFSISTPFKETDGWSSLIALLIISMADEEYNVTLKGEDIRSAKTIGDILHIIEFKTA